MIFCYDASTGKPVWKVNTISPASNSSTTSKFGTGGAWETPLVGRDGSVTFGIRNPYQTAAAGDEFREKYLFGEWASPMIRYCNRGSLKQLAASRAKAPAHFVPLNGAAPREPWVGMMPQVSVGNH